MTSAPRVSRADLEAKFRQLQGDVTDGLDSTRDVGRLAAGVGTVLVVGIVYLLGRRHGRKKRTIVEITRV